MLDTWRAGLQLAWRGLRRAPGPDGGSGGDTLRRHDRNRVMFALVAGVLLRPLPVADE